MTLKDPRPEGYNLGALHGAQRERKRIFEAADFVSYEDKNGHRILSLEDLQEELQIRDEGRDK